MVDTTPTNVCGQPTRWLTERIAAEETKAETREGNLGPVSFAVLMCSPSSVWSSAGGDHGPSPSDPDAAAHIPTKVGHRVRSFQEAEITNLMAMLGYNAAYEAPYIAATTGNYTPDWYLGRSGATGAHAYLEHFGIDREGNTRQDIDSARYNEEITWKRSTHHRNGTQLLETYTYDFTEQAWHARLVAQMHQWNLDPSPTIRAAGDFDRRIQNAARKVSGDLAAFVRVARETRVDLDAAGQRLPGNAEGWGWGIDCGDEEWNHLRDTFFFDLAREAVEVYENELTATNTIDFSDMCSAAATQLREHAQQRWAHVLVDEFQDTAGATAALRVSAARATPRSRKRSQPPPAQPASPGASPFRC